MKQIVLLKGLRSSGKSHALRRLPLLIDAKDGQMKLWYKSKLIWIIRRSLHESPDWKLVLKKIDRTAATIIILPAWDDAIINKSGSLALRLS